MGAFLNFVVFPKISGLYQKHRLPWHQLEKLGEVFKNNFLTVMQDLKRRIKAGTAKNRCHTISEWSLIHNLSVMHFYCKLTICVHNIYAKLFIFTMHIALVMCLQTKYSIYAAINHLSVDGK